MSVWVSIALGPNFGAPEAGFFPAPITMASWLRHRDSAGQSGRYIRSPSEGVPHFSIDAKSQIFAWIRKGQEPGVVQAFRCKLAVERLDSCANGNTSPG